MDMDKMKEKLNKIKGNGGNGDSALDHFWRVDVGDHEARVVPVEDGDPFKEFYIHYRVGGHKPFLCPNRNFNEYCAVCDMSEELFDEYNETGDQATRDVAYDLKASKRFYSPVIVRGREDEGVLWWGYSPKVQRYILEEIVFNEDYGDISDPEEGFDLKISKKETDQQVDGRNITETNVTPRRLPNPIFDDGDGELDEERFQKEKEEMKDIRELLIEYSPEQTEEALDDHMKDLEQEQEGEDQKYSDSEEETPDNSETEEESETKSKKEKYRDVLNG